MRLNEYRTLIRNAFVTGDYLDTSPPWTADRPHLGVDFGTAMGTPVPAIRSGFVHSLRTPVSGPGDGSFGYHVVIRGDDGVFDLYAHLSAFRATKGQRVQVGQIIGESGDSGAQGHGSYAPHLHVQRSESDMFPRLLSVTRDPFGPTESEPDDTGMDEATIRRIIREEFAAVVADAGPADLGEFIRYMTARIDAIHRATKRGSANEILGEIHLATDLTAKIEDIERIARDE